MQASASRKARQLDWKVQVHCWAVICDWAAASVQVALHELAMLGSVGVYLVELVSSLQSATVHSARRAHRSVQFCVAGTGLPAPIPESWLPSESHPKNDRASRATAGPSFRTLRIFIMPASLGERLQASMRPIVAGVDVTRASRSLG